MAYAKKNLISHSKGGKNLTCGYPAKPYFSFESHNYPGKFIRHAYSYGELSKIDIGNSLDAKDATFALDTGLAPGSASFFSFESYNYPGHVLRHKNGRIKLEKEQCPGPDVPSSQLFAKDATFKIVPGLADSSAVSFQSYNYSNAYLRHRDGHLWVESSDINPGTFKEDATFRIVAPRASP